MKVLKNTSYLIALLAILCIYSWMVATASVDSNSLGKLRKPILDFARLPQLIEEVLSSPEVNNIPVTYMPANASLKEINNLQYDVYGVSSFWNEGDKVWEMKLINLRNDSTLHTWVFHKKNFIKNKYLFQNSSSKHVVILENKDLIGRLTESPNLFRMDEHSNIVWINNELRYHHSVNLDSKNNLWVCGADIYDDDIGKYSGGLVNNLDGKTITYRDDYIVNVDSKTGKILFKKGVAEILRENNYKGILYGGEVIDPIHLNDIQPVLNDGEYWKEDDLFLSVRSRSIVILYRPSTNKIIKILRGPFINQHDVDFVSDTEISIFNNNHIIRREYSSTKPYMEIDSLKASEILIYDFKTETYRQVLQDVFLANNINTKGQGLYEFLENGDILVEEHNNGTYHIINKNETVLRKVFYTPDSNYIHIPSWMRIYETIPFKE